ncbi:RHS repeat-associated core domain-containing protein [Microbulbifer sp. TYP-18]|uniref:RHS repeat-associated core domain-containing protein n=1 Tax=Microbulbifer sp. TYP-18 TaxID=3230024 RepID=UPI0034C65270
MSFKCIGAKRENNPALISFLVAVLAIAGLFSISPASAFHFPWDQGHDTTDPNDPVDPGPCEGPECENDPCNGNSTGSPVYLATGQLIWSETDIVLKGRPALSVSRTYNSHDPRVGLLGNGWSMSCDRGLIYTVRYEVDETSNLTTQVREFIRRLPNGKRYVYSEQADGTFSAPGLFDVVSLQANKTGRLERRDGSYAIYSESGQLQSDVDRNGNSVNYTYDIEGRLTQKADTNGRSLTYEYNTNGLVSMIRDHTGRVWHYGYDANADLISVTDPLGGVRQYTYQPYQATGDGQVYSQLTRVTDETGVVETQITYSGERVASHKEHEDTFSYQYDSSNRRVTKTDSRNSRWIFTYNESGQTIQVAAPLNRTWIYDRDSDSLLTRMVDPLGTEYNYTYDQYSNLLTQSDTRGVVTNTYDNEKPWPISIISRTGRATTINYDTNGNPLSITDPTNAVTSMTWTAQGDLLTNTNALGNQTSLTYNAQGMRLSQTDALNRETRFEYDSLNNIVQITNPENEVMHYQYDILDRMTSSTDGNGNTTTYSYDAAGRITQIVAPNGQAVEYSYDNFGRMNQSTFYDGTTHNYQYRSDNLISQIKRPDDVIISLTYDAAKRITRRTIGSEDIYTYSYNLRDELTSISNNTGTVTMAYDGFGRKISQTVNGQATTYQYNTEDEVTQLTSLGITQTHQFDQRGLMTQLDVSGSTYQYTYDAFEQLTVLGRSGANDTRIQYDVANQITDISHGVNQRNYQYQYDQASRISQWQGIAGETRNYSYDDVSRVTDVQSPTTPEEFSYDMLGNRKNNNAQFDVANRILEDDEFTYSYDVNGNRTEKNNKVTGEVERYTYNSSDQLVRYQNYPDSTSTAPVKDYSYSYGPLKRRWLKADNLTNTNTQFYWEDVNLIGESTNGVQRRYILGDMTPLGFFEAGQIYHYLRDHLGTAHEIIDATGNIVWQGNYITFGEIEETISLINNNLRFAGQYQDTESGLSYNVARYYDPSLGIYVTSDPVGLDDGPNTYSYVYNRPLMLIDPTGEFANFLVGAGIGALLDIGLQLAQNGGNFRCINLGQVAASAALGAVGAGLGAKLAGAAGKGKQFSHWVPSRAKNWPGFSGKTGKKFLKPGNKFNGNYVSKKRHYKHDPYAYGNVKGEHLNWGGKWSRPVQQLDRIPNVYKGAVAGGAVGNAAGSSLGSSDCECSN